MFGPRHADLDENAFKSMAIIEVAMQGSMADGRNFNFGRVHRNALSGSRCPK